MEHLEILRLTEALRNGDDQIWERIRLLLRERGIKAEKAYLAYSEPEDPFYEIGIIVTEDGRVFQYGFDCLHREVHNGIFKEWIELTGHFEKTPYKNQVREALRVAAREKHDAS